MGTQSDEQAKHGQLSQAMLSDAGAKIVLRPLGHDGDITSFKASFSAAFADSLRQSGTALTIDMDQLTSQQRAAIQEVIDKRARENRLGSRNLLVAVRRSSQGRQCTLKRHFSGCERQLIGFGELLAVKDSEGFVWMTMRGWRMHAKKEDGSLFSESHIWHRLQILEALGLLIPARRYRHRVWRQGFIVARHDDLAHIEGERCVLALEKSKISPRRPGEKRVGIGPGLSGLVPD